MMRKKILIMWILLLESITVIKAQISRGEWTLGPIISTTNNFYGNIAECLIFGNIPLLSKDATYLWRNRWWIPYSYSRYAVLQKINTPLGKASIKWWDWGLVNYSVGYHCGFIPKFFPVGFDIKVDYERKGMKVKLPQGTKYITYSKQMIVPTFLLKIPLRNYLENSLIPIVEIGGSYDFSFHCKGEYSDRKSINDGLTGIIGLGLGNSESHIAFSFRYEYDFYNYFNRNFTPDGKTYPYQGWKTKLGCLDFILIVGF